MQTDSEHIHECNHPDRSPKICFQTNFGTVNVNSHNTHSFQMDNCGNRSQCWSLLLLISCFFHSSGSHLSDSVTKINDPSIDEEGSRSLESQGRYLVTYPVAHAITSLSRFCPRNSYHFPFPYVASGHTVHGSHFGRLYGLQLSNTHHHGLHISRIDPNSYSI